MRILFLSTWHPCPPDNGSKQRVYHLLRALAERHAITLCGFAFDTALPMQPSVLGEWGIEVHTVCLDPFAVNWVPAWRKFLSPDPTFARAVPQMQTLLTQVLSETAFDVIIASTGGMAVYALEAPGQPVKVLEEHNSLSRWMHDRLTNASSPLSRLRCWASWQKARRYERDLFRRFDCITMVSELDRLASAALAPELKNRILAIPNGVDCEANRPRLANNPEAGALVFNGALTYSANYDAMRWFLSDIYPRINAQRPDVSLTVTGSTRNVNLGGLQLDQSVTFSGYVDDMRVPITRAAVCVVPIREGGGTRLKILEAMALGTPVIATRKGAEGLDVVDGEHLLLADDPATFARLTTELLRNPALRSRLAVNARRLVAERYDWRCIGAHFAQVVEQAAAARGGLRP